jgi:steroid delta-isomerase
MSNAIGDYFRALSDIDREAYLACFDENATILDPYGGRPLTGVDGLNKFMDGVERTWDSFSMTPREMIAVADRVAASWSVVATAKSGKSAEFSGINIFTLNEAGKISRLEGYWDFKAMLAQIS